MYLYIIFFLGILDTASEARSCLNFSGRLALASNRALRSGPAGAPTSKPAGSHQSLEPGQQRGRSQRSGFRSEQDGDVEQRVKTNPGQAVGEQGKRGWW